MSKEVTEMLDLARDRAGDARTSLDRLVPKRSRRAHKPLLQTRGQSFESGVEYSTPVPFHDHKRATVANSQVPPRLMTST